MATYPILRCAHRTCAGLLLLMILASLALSAVPNQAIAAQGPEPCPGNPPSRLAVGGIAIVSPGDPDNLRRDPSLESPVLAQLAAGIQLQVIGGPTCADGYLWWRVQQWAGPQGWIAEGHGSNYYLLPFAAPIVKQTRSFTLPA